MCYPVLELAELDRMKDFLDGIAVEFQTDTGESSGILGVLKS